MADDAFCRFAPPSLHFNSHHRNLITHHTWEQALHRSSRCPTMVDHTPIVPPDLASVLATLAQFAPNQTQLQHAQSNTTSANWQQSSLSSGKGAAAVLNVPQTRTPQPEKQVIDPATITEWSAGLRCVTKIAAQNRHFAESIRRVRTYCSDYPNFESVAEICR